LFNSGYRSGIKLKTMIGPGGTFVNPGKKPWNHKPSIIDGTNYMFLTEKEIEELSDEELYVIGRTLWERIPTLDHDKLAEKIINKMKKEKQIK